MFFVSFLHNTLIVKLKYFNKAQCLALLPHSKEVTGSIPRLETFLCAVCTFSLYLIGSLRVHQANWTLLVVARAKQLIILSRCECSRTFLEVHIGMVMVESTG